MYSHEELISAVCAAGQDGKTFTVKDVRTQLGFESRDKKELSRFRRRLRAFEKAASDQLEKLGNNSYRLRPGAFEQKAGARADQEVQLEPASGVFQSVSPANEPVGAASPQPVASPAVHAAEPGNAPAPHEAAAALREIPPADKDADAPALRELELTASRASEHATAPALEPAEAPALHAAELMVMDAPGLRLHEAAATDTLHDAASARTGREREATATLHSVPVADAPGVRSSSATHTVEPSATSPAPGVVSSAPAEAPALHAVEPRDLNAEIAATRQPGQHSTSTPQRVFGAATALVSGAFAASAAVSGKVRAQGRNLREQLWMCLRSAPARKHAFARLRGWAEGLRPLSIGVREHLTALRERVLSSRRRAA